MVGESACIITAPPPKPTHSWRRSSDWAQKLLRSRPTSPTTISFAGWRSLAPTQLGAPTCLVNNAARFEWDSIDTLDWAGWQAELDVNLRAPIFLTQAFARTLPKDASGCVINMIDQRVWRLTPDFFSYTIAKSALWTATQTLAQALSPRVRVNALGPGPVLPNRRQSQADFERECRSTLLGRGAMVDDVCRTVRFLLDTPSVTGQMIALDSGQHLAWR
jgi:NAD(P)-dependent dehydrogenase (short-subunit alcohol dehydrogenase family)